MFKRQAINQAINKLQKVSSEAVDTLRNIMQNDAYTASSRVTAARSILEMALRAAELLDDIIMRIEQLEAQTGGCR